MASPVKIGIFDPETFSFAGMGLWLTILILLSAIFQRPKFNSSNNWGLKKPKTIPNKGPVIKNVKRKDFWPILNLFSIFCCVVCYLFDLASSVVSQKLVILERCFPQGLSSGQISIWTILPRRQGALFRGVSSFSLSFFPRSDIQVNGNKYNHNSLLYVSWTLPFQPCYQLDAYQSVQFYSDSNISNFSVGYALDKFYSHWLSR